MAAAAILDFWNSKILLAIVAKRVETHQYAKLCQNGSIGCEDIKIFWFFKMAAIHQIHKNLLAAIVWRAHTHHCTKFHQNRLFRCGNIVILQIFKMAAKAILDYWNREILLTIGVQKVEHATLCQNRSIGCKDIKIFRFFKMAAIRHLGFVWGIFGLSKWVLVGLCYSAKFGYDWCSSFYNMNISIFGTFGWKMPIHALKIGVFGAIWSPKWAAISTEAKKGTPLRESASFEPLSV